MKKIILQKGFTLIELLVVIAIIGILAGILFIAINPAEQSRKAEAAKILTTLKGIEKAIQLTSVDGKNFYELNSFNQKNVQDLINNGDLQYISHVEKIFGDRDIIYDGYRGSSWKYTENCSSNTIQMFLGGENLYVKVDADDKDLIDEINRIVDGDDITKNCGKIRYYTLVAPYGGPFLIYDIAS